MKRWFYFVFISMVIWSCNESIKFDSSKWKAAGGEKITLDIRTNMVTDLIESKILLNKDRSELIELIGFSSRLNNLESDSILYFPVQEKYGSDIDPEEMIFLKITLDNNGKSVAVVLHSSE